MRVYPPNKQTVGTYANPLLEIPWWTGRDGGRVPAQSSCFLLELAVGSHTQHGGPPAGDMTQVSSWTLLLANVPTKREGGRQREEKEAG